MKLIFIIALGITLYSCCTLTNKRTVDVTIDSDIDSVKICINKDTLHWYTTPATISLERSDKYFLITAKKDTLLKELIIRSHSSNNYAFTNLLTLGIGYFVDRNNPKRFTYPEYIPIQFKDHSQDEIKSKAWLKPWKGCLNFKISIPEGNHFYQNIGTGYRTTFGFNGISLGAEYYFTDKYCINFDVGGLTDIFVPFGPVDYFGSFNTSSALYGDIQIGCDYDIMHFDFGLQYHKTFYNHFVDEEYYTPAINDSLSYTYSFNNYGLAFSTYFKITNWFNLGLNYYPSFIGWDDDKKVNIHYTHLLFFEVLFKFGYFNLI
jgi:hypothetical protein